MDTAQAFQKLYDTIIRLRGPGGCPWDHEQSPSTLRGDLIEETFECIEAIDEQNPAHTQEELGDLFLLVTMISYMHEQSGAFSVADVLESLVDKLIRRHPHVFGDVQVKDSAEVLKNWAEYKVQVEKRAPKDSLLDTVPRGIPPLDRAYKLQKKAAKVGFEWDKPEEIIDKIREELVETQAELDSGNNDALEAELGDVLFAAINLCRFLKIDPSIALQRTNTKFTKRFTYIEKKMKESGIELSSGHCLEMERYWQEAKTLSENKQE
ncbi:nucleoside triphosphate pyrophosphohydrolase [Spirochaetia bacterium]|nr:nucleoside triphosphate pyrophosphohydrolase [Spirochaetia bacterium]